MSTSPIWNQNEPKVSENEGIFKVVLIANVFQSSVLDSLPGPISTSFPSKVSSWMLPYEATGQNTPLVSPGFVHEIWYASGKKTFGYFVCPKKVPETHNLDSKLIEIEKLFLPQSEDSVHLLWLVHRRKNRWRVCPPDPPPRGCQASRTCARCWISTGTTMHLLAGKYHLQ